MKKNYRYLIRLQYLGFRYSGWQIQPGQRTVSEMLGKTFSFLYPDEEYKILGAGRTDAKVSSLNGAFELFLKKPIANCNQFLAHFNVNLPPDIRAISIEKVTTEFNIIKDVCLKEYVYLFAYGTKAHPYAAPFLHTYLEELDLEQMKIAANLFEGTHDFSVYTVDLKDKTSASRTVSRCEIVENHLLQASFFPKTSYALHIKGKGFMRYQIRLMMGALALVGQHKLSILDIEQSLQPNSNITLKTIAPGSGLHVNLIDFNQA